MSTPLTTPQLAPVSRRTHHAPKQAIRTKARLDQRKRWILVGGIVALVLGMLVVASVWLST